MSGNKNSGRKRIPILQKKLNGTFRPDRDSKAEQKEKLLSEICNIDENTTIACPKTITDEVAIEFWNTETKFLINCKILKPQDLPQLESLCKDLQMIRSINAKLDKLEITDPSNEEIDILLRRKSRLENSYNTKCMKFFVSPADRSKLALDTLDIERKHQENQTAISKIISRNSVNG